MFDDKAQAALALANAMCGSTSVMADDLNTTLRDLFTEVERAELILVCGQANLNNRAGNIAKQLLGERTKE